MNKLLTLAAACTLALGFTACEDVPSPYGLPTEKQQQQPASKEVLLEESFASSLGSFKNYTTSGEGAWKIDFKTAKASGYDNAAKKTTAGTYYLVSPEVDLTAAKTEGAHVALEYILRYNKADENQQLLITDAYNADKPTEGWTVLNQKWTEGSDWKTYTSANFDIPEAFLGKKVRIAFRYNSDDKSGSTWQIKNVKLALGHLDKPAQPTPTPAPAPTGDNLLSNAGFENWDGAAPAVWKSSIGNASLSQSTTAHGGQYAVKVTGDAKVNKRLSYAELNLKAGTYTFTYYVYGAEANAHLKTGYAIMTDHKVADFKTDYIYSDPTTVTQGAWSLVTYTFKLDRPKTICLLVMNQKGSGAFLVDDAQLTPTNGGLQ